MRSYADVPLNIADKIIKDQQSSPSERVVVSLKTQTNDWQEFTLPVTQEQIESWRKVWEKWQSENKTMFDIGNNDRSTMDRVLELDKHKMLDFDRIILGHAIIAPRRNLKFNIIHKT